MAARKKTSTKPDPSDIETVSLDDLKPDEQNANKGDVESIAKSLREFGQHRPIVARRQDGTVIAGNHTFLAAQSLGWTEMVVWWVDDDDKTAIRRALADNATARKSQWDEAQLASLLMDVGSVPGIDDKEMAKRIAKMEQEVALTTDPEYPIVQRMYEQYDYVVVTADNEVDVAWLHSKLGLERQRSSPGKAESFGLGRVITVDQLKAAFDA